MADNAAAERPRRRRLDRRAGLLIAFLIIIAISAFSFRALRQVVETSRLVDHTQRVQVALATLQADLTDAETGQRGHMLTGDRRLLEPYERAIRDLPTTLAEIEQLVADNPRQAARLTVLLPLVADRVARLKAGVQRRENEGPAAVATALGPLIAGKAVMDQIRASLHEMQEEEDALYRERAGRANADAVRAQYLILGGTTGSLLIIGAIFLLMRGEARRREAAEARLQHVNTELAVRIAERTAVLADRERFLNAVIETMRDAVLVVRRSTVVFANRACLELLGARSLDQVVGSPPLVFVHPDDHETLIMRLEQLQSSGGRLPTIDLRIARLDDKSLDVEMNAATFEDGKDRSQLVMLRDVTGRKATENALRQAQKMDAIGQLSGGIAHDFNNLLTVIIANLDILSEGLRGDPANAEIAEAALRGALRGAELTRRLLAFARRQPLEPKVVDLNQRLPEITAVLKRTLGETVKVTTALAADLWLTRADPSQIDDALVNLTINARDAMPNGGELMIETANVRLDEVYAAQNADATPGEYVMLAVTDFGTGMPLEVVERATEPFFTTKALGRGTGLGLSMIYGFAKQSGGHLKIYSEVGIGTTVKLYLPRARSAEMGGAAEWSEGSDALPRGSETILLVEDNPDVREAAVRQLGELGYALRVAENGPEALRLIESDAAFDLLFTDIVMPEGMTGYELAEAARRRRPGIKVLYTTGYAKAPTANGNGLQPGTPMIGKPYRRQELARKVRDTLDGTG